MNMPQEGAVDMSMSGKLRITVGAALASALLAAACGAPEASEPEVPPRTGALQPPSPAPAAQPAEASAPPALETATAVLGTPPSPPPPPPPPPVEPESEPALPSAPAVLETSMVAAVDEHTRVFIEVFGDRSEYEGEPSSVLTIGFWGRFRNSAKGGTSHVDSETQEISGHNELPLNIAHDLIDAGLAPPVYRVEAYRANRYARAVGRDSEADAYIVRAFGDFDADAAARALEELELVRYACEGHCAGPPLPPEWRPAPERVFCVFFSKQCHPLGNVDSEQYRERLDDTFRCAPSSDLGCICPVAGYELHDKLDYGCHPVHDHLPPGYAFAREVQGRDPILLNNPPPPIHTTGEPYPLGTFPPEHEHLWNELTGILQTPNKLAWWGEWEDAQDRIIGPPPVCMWGGGTTGARSTAGGIGYVRDQLIFWSTHAIDNPEAAIADYLRDEGVQFESIEVRGADYYSQYDSAVFYNWLAPENYYPQHNPAEFGRFNPIEAFRRLGAELNSGFIVPENAVTDVFAHPGLWRWGPTLTPGDKVYQVLLHGHEGDVRDYDLSLEESQVVSYWYGYLHTESTLQHARPILFNRNPPCPYTNLSSQQLTEMILGGVYTMFGDDVVIYDDPREQPLHPFDPWIESTPYDPSTYESPQQQPLEEQEPAVMETQTADTRNQGGADDSDDAGGEEDDTPAGDTQDGQDGNSGSGLEMEMQTGSTSTASTRMPAAEAESSTAGARQ